MSPLVSVCIPAYNAERYLGEAIESALAQTYPHIEVVVVDDGSADDTLAVARRYEAAHPDRLRAFTQPNAGACAARNHAFRESRGAHVKFLDADDALTPEAVASQLAALDGEPTMVIPYGTHCQCDARLELRRRPSGGRAYATAAFSEDRPVRAAALLEWSPQTARPLHTRALVERVGGFDERLRRGQEYDFHLRLALAGARFKRVETLGVLVREHDSPTRISNRTDELKEQARREGLPDRRALLVEAFGEPLPTPLQDAFARRAWRSMRSLARAGDFDGARRIAEHAHRLDPNLRQAPGAAFRRLSRVIGPVRAERALQAAKRLLRRGRPLST